MPTNTTGSAVQPAVEQASREMQEMCRFCTRGGILLHGAGLHGLLGYGAGAMAIGLRPAGRMYPGITALWGSRGTQLNSFSMRYGYYALEQGECSEGYRVGT